MNDLTKYNQLLSMQEKVQNQRKYCCVVFFTNEQIFFAKPGKIKGRFPKKSCCSFGFCPNEGGGKALSNFLSFFHKLYIKVDRHSQTCKKKRKYSPFLLPKRGCSSFFCSNTLPSFATDTYKQVAQGSLFVAKTYFLIIIQPL